MPTEGDQNGPATADAEGGGGRTLSSPLPRRVPDPARRPVLPAQRPAPQTRREPSPTDLPGRTWPTGRDLGAPQRPGPDGTPPDGRAPDSRTPVGRTPDGTAPDRAAPGRAADRAADRAATGRSIFDRAAPGGGPDRTAAGSTPAPGRYVPGRPAPQRTAPPGDAFSVPVFGAADPTMHHPAPLADPGPLGDRAGTAQGLLLMAGSSVPVLGGVLAAPLLPTISQEFASVPGVAALVPLIIGVHGLSVALMAPFAGALLDRFGRTRLLVAALVVVALAGTAPAYLPGLPLILGSRVVLGAAVAFVVVSCTTLIGDYFPGAQRDRWLGWQVVATSLSATAFFVVGGALGESGWRTPFWVFLIALVLVPFVVRLLPDPVTTAASARADRSERRRTPWRLLLLPCGLTLVTSMLFYVVPTQLSYVLVEQGVSSTSTIGFITGGAALATGIGGFLIGNLAVDRLWLLLPVESALTAVGLLMLGLSGDSLVLAANGAMLASVGGGMLVATLLIWTMRVLDGAGIRGLGTGSWTCAFFLGQFLGPVVVTAVAAGQVGGLQQGIAGLGVVGVVLVLGTVVLGLVNARKPAAEERTA